MPKYKVTTEKGTYLIETEDASTPSQGTMTADQAKQAMGQSRQAFAALQTPDPRTTGQVVKDSIMNGLEGIGQFEAGIPGALVEGGKMVADAFNPLEGTQRNLARSQAVISGGKQVLAPLANDAAALVSTKYAPSDPDQQRAYQNFAGQVLGGTLMSELIAQTPGAVQSIRNAFPNKAAAGEKFGQVMAQAKDVPLDLSAADDAALRAQELAGRGGLPGRGSSLPKVMRDYLRTRETNPTMTYEVGRDFQSSAGRLSASEAQAANPVMKAQVAKLAKALAESNRAAAVKVGMGAEYDAAMSEYAKAARMADMKSSLIDVMKNRAVQTGLGTGLGYGIYKALKGN